MSKQKYELRRGTHRTPDGELHTPGDVIELTEQQARVLTRSEKFHPLPDDDARVEAAEAEAAEDDADDEEEGDEMEDVDTIERVVAPDATIPDDYNDLQTLAKVYSGPEVDGRSSKDDIQSFLAGLPDEDLVALKQDAGLSE